MEAFSSLIVPFDPVNLTRPSANCKISAEVSMRWLAHAVDSEVCVVTQVQLFSLDYDMYQCPVYSWHCLTATLYS